MPNSKPKPGHKSAIAHLRDCLKLQNNDTCLNVIINNIMEVGRRLNPTSDRKDALKAIEEELKESYPDIFSDEDCEKRVYFAAQIAMGQHDLKKQNAKKKEKARQLSRQEGTLASKSVGNKRDSVYANASKKSAIRHSLSTPKQASEQDQAPVDATNHATVQLSKKRKAKDIPDSRHSLPASMPGFDEQDENQAVIMHATDKSSGTRSVNMMPHIGRTPSASIELDEDQAPLHATGKVLDKRKTITIPNIRRSSSISMQGIYEQDKDHSAMDVAVHGTDIISNKKTKKIPDIQDENQVPMNVTMLATTDKAFGKMKSKDKRRLSSIPTRERDEDQAPINVEMHTMDNKVSDRMPLSKRMALNMASIANTPSVPSMFASSSLRAHASGVSSSSPFSQPRRLFVPHISKSQLQLSNTPSQPGSTLGDPCCQHASASMPHPATYSTSADASSSLPTSKSSPMHGSVVSKSDKIKCVHHFLEACVPSMSYLLPRFIDYGCTHEGFLLAVSMWPPERIKKFLVNVVTGPDGQLISPMEQMVLENHLTQYFKA